MREVAILDLELMQLTDLLQTQSEYANHRETFSLWPASWAGFKLDSTLKWSTVRLADDQRPGVPSEPGVYTFLICPGIAEHPSCSYLVYVGKAVSLRERFGRYLGRERRISGRPKMVRGLNNYSDYLYFCFTPVPESLLEKVEDALIDAFDPPWNDKLSARLQPLRGAF